MTLFWRTFVYNASVDTDRLKRAYMEFKPINDDPSRSFGDNVFVQTKNGPLDFQGREPFHPMFGAMDQTNQAIEVQITQEYTGHHISLCYLGTEWEEIYKSDTMTGGKQGLVGEVLGTQEQAEKVASAVEGWVAELDALTKDIPDSEKPSVYLGAVSFSGGHGFCGTFCNYAPLMAIHANNLADSLGEKGGVEIAMEQVIEWDPDIIFLNPGNMNLVMDDYEDNPDAIDSLRAVQNGQVYAQVNFNMFNTNMELAIVDAYYAGTVLYPEAFQGIDFNAKAEEIFNVIQEKREKLDVSFVLDTLVYLRKGGRCSALAALGANLLSLKPCIEVRGGSMGVGKKYRGTLGKCVVQYVRDRLEGRDDLKRIFITDSTGFTQEELDAVEAEVRRCQSFEEVLHTNAGCTVSNHCGPRCIGILYFHK